MRSAQVPRPDPPRPRPDPPRPRPGPPRPDRDGPLLTQRAAVVFPPAAPAGIGSAVLAALAGNAWPVAVGVGGGTTAAAVLSFKEIIG